MKMHLNATALLPLTLALAACNGGTEVSSPQMPSKNPFLVDSELATTHFGPAQQDSLSFEGPRGIHELDESQIQRVAGGMVNLTILQGPKYESGEEDKLIGRMSRQLDKSNEETRNILRRIDKQVSGKD